jgi:hypothetical protein
MNYRVLCICIVAIVALLALLLLFYVTGKPSNTGAVSTNICPDSTAPLIAGEDYVRVFKEYERRGFRCFFGYDSITPCCVRR